MPGSEEYSAGVNRRRESHRCRPAVPDLGGGVDQEEPQPARGQVVADREARLAGADDERVERCARRRLRCGAYEGWGRWRRTWGLLLCGGSSAGLSVSFDATNGRVRAAPAKSPGCHRMSRVATRLTRREGAGGTATAVARGAGSRAAGGGNPVVHPARRRRL